MGKMRSNVSMKLNGKVGAFTFYTSEGRQIARTAQNSSNYGKDASRTPLQQNHRVRWANLVNFYKASKDWMYYAFESKKPGVSDYNKFMKINVSDSRCALTKSQAAAGACVVEPWQVTEGSLMPIEISHVGDIWVTSIKIGLNEITNDTTVMEFTQSVLGANSWLRDNMQISFISYQQLIDNAGVPRIICTPYEMTLSTTSTAKVRAYLPEFCSSVSEGYLSTNNNISVGTFAYILSETISGKTYVSTQRLINNNSNVINQFSTQQQFQDAIKSYGENSTKFLMSGSNQTDATQKVFFIEYIDINNVRYDESRKILQLGDVVPKTILIKFSSKVSNVTGIWLITTNGEGAIEEATTITDGVANESTFSAKISPVAGEKFIGEWLLRVRIVADGITYVFGNSQYGGPTGE